VDGRDWGSEPALDLCIIIPAYNESHTIAKTIGDYQETFPDARIVVIDNNSTDDTGGIAQGMLRHGKDLLLTERRQGKGAAVKSGLGRVSSDVYIMVDGDGTYLARDAMRLLQVLKDERCDMVVGDRVSRGTYASQNVRPGHDLGNRYLTRFISFLAGQKYVDVLSGLRIMSRAFVNVLDVRSAGFQLETELNVIAAYVRADVVEVPIDYLQRPEGSSSKLNTINDGVKIVWFTLINWISFYPLQPLGLFAAIAFVISGILGINVFLVFFEFGTMPYASTAIAAAAAGLVGLQSIFAGLILRILMRERRRSEVARLLEMRRQWNAKLDA
jgi:glycosyltransferase involved in cell wall biosynthesis